MEIKVFVAFLASIFIIFISSSADAAVYNCNSCDSCTSAIQSAQAGDVIQLTQNIINYSVGHCVRFNGKDNLTFDCQGNIINGPYTGDPTKPPPNYFGIHLDSSNGGSNYNEIRNCIISNFGSGVYMQSSSNNILNGLVLNVHNQQGIYIDAFSNYNRIQSCSLNVNTIGIWAYGGGSNNTISGTSFNENIDGLFIVYGSGNIVTDSSFNYNRYAIHITGSESNIIKNTRIENSYGEGIGLVYDSYSSKYSRFNLFYNNYINNWINVISTDSMNQNYWNTTKDCTRTNIIGGPCIGGNFWTNNDTNGFSDTCVDGNGDGICDSAYSPAQNNWDQTPLSRLADSVPPSVPTGLVAIPLTMWEVLLGWNAASDNIKVMGYRIYRNGSLVASTPDTYFVDYWLTPNSTYEYRVSAYDASNNEGGMSSPVYVTTTLINDTVPPSVPQNLQATAVSASQINLTWSPATDNVGVVGYIVFRNGTWMTWTTNAYYQDSGLSALTTYTYSVKAFDSVFNLGSMSSLAIATTPGSGSTSPNLIFVYPTPLNNSQTLNRWAFINISSDKVLSSCRLNWNNGTFSSNITMNILGSYCYLNKTSLEFGNHTFKVYANDSGNNWNSIGANYLSVCLHESDASCNGCVEMPELLAYIGRWYINNLDVTMSKMMEAIGLYNGGCQ